MRSHHSHPPAAKMKVLPSSRRRQVPMVHELWQRLSLVLPPVTTVALAPLTAKGTAPVLTLHHGVGAKWAASCVQLARRSISSRTCHAYCVAPSSQPNDMLKGGWLDNATASAVPVGTFHIFRLR